MIYGNINNNFIIASREYFVVALATIPLNFNAFLEKAKLKDDGSNYTDCEGNMP